MSCSLVQSLSKTLKHFKLYQFLPKEKGGNAVGKQKVSHATDTLEADEDSHILPESCQKGSSVLPHGQNIAVENNSSMTEAAGFKGTIAVGMALLCIKYMK